jgi:glucokinase
MIRSPPSTNNSPQVVGVDLGGSGVRVYSTSSPGNCSWNLNLTASHDAGVLRLLQRIASEHHAGCMGVAVSATLVPGTTSMRISTTSSKYAALTEAPHGGVIQEIEKSWSHSLGCPVFLTGDGEAAACEVAVRLSELVPTATPSLVTVLTIGTSVGVGHVVHGRPFFGSYTSQASHLLLDSRGEPCDSGQHCGCWKTLIGARARATLADQIGIPKRGDISETVNEAREGSAHAIAYIDALGQRIAQGLAVLVTAFPTDYIIIGGGIAAGGQLLESSIHAALSAGLVDRDIMESIRISVRSDISIARGAHSYAQLRLQGASPCGHK